MRLEDHGITVGPVGAAGQREARGSSMPDTTSGRRRRGGRRPFAGPVIVLCALVASLVAADYWANAGAIYRGVSAGSVPLGGETLEEARGLLEARAAGTLDEVALRGQEGYTLGTAGMDVDFDAAATAERAYGLGRSGGLLGRLGDRARAAFGVARVAPAVDYREGAVLAAVEGLAGRVDREPRSASVAVRGAEARVVGAEKGYELDVQATAENVGLAIEGLTGEAQMAGEVLQPELPTREAEEAAAEARRALSGEVVLKAEGRRWTLRPEEIGHALGFAREGAGLGVALDEEVLEAGLRDVEADLEVRPVEAGYDTRDGITVTPGREGRRVEMERLVGALERGLLEGKREYEVPVVIDEPELTTAEAEKSKPTEMLGSYRTDYSIVPDTGARVENLQISSGAVSGTLLAPGEVFSMNDKVSGLDYNETKVIINGKETKADGGGLCQVTSTLYNAVNEAGLDVTERYPHYAQLPYIRPGLDATVWFGGPGEADDLDMKFENTSDGYVLLKEYVAEDGFVYAEVWGRPGGAEVKTWSEAVYRNAESAEWVTYQTYKKNGKIVFDGVLHKDTYEALKDEKGKPIPADTVPIAPVDP